MARDGWGAEAIDKREGRPRRENRRVSTHDFKDSRCVKCGTFEKYGDEIDCLGG